MYLTWKNIVEIIMIIFNLSQSKLADKFTIDRSRVNDVLKGKRKTWPRDTGETYTGVFDLANPESIASEKGENEESVFDLLKQLLAGNGFNELIDKWIRIIDKGNKSTEKENFATSECSYKEFVLMMLNHVDRNSRRGAIHTIVPKFQEYNKPPAQSEKLQLKLTHTMPKAFRNFIAREKEFEKMNKLLSVNHYLILEGMGGIGKTELAKQYAYKHSSQYDAIQFIRFSHSIEDTIANKLEFDNIDEKWYFDKYEPDEAIEILFAKKLSALCSCANRNLIVIDNGGAIHIEEKLAAPNGEYDVICTTREKSCGSVLEITAMPVEDLLRLFCEYYKLPLSVDDEPAVRDVISLVLGHTMTVMIIALAIHRCDITPQEMLERLQNGFDPKLRTEISIKKADLNDRERKAVMYEHLANLFDMTKMNQNESFIMTNMAIAPYFGIKKKMFYEDALSELYKEESFNDKNYTDIDNLIALRWIQYDEQTNCISLHPIISDIATMQLKPDSKKCKDFICNMVDIAIVLTNQNYTKRTTGAELLKLACKRINDETWYTAMLNNIYGLIVNLLADYPKAIKHLKKAVNIVEKREECLDTAFVFKSFGEALLNKEDFQESLNWNQKALIIFEKELGTEHLYTAEIYYNIGLTYFLQRQYEEAMKWYDKVLQIKDVENDKDFRIILTNIFSHIAFINFTSGDHGKQEGAIEWYNMFLSALTGIDDYNVMNSSPDEFKKLFETIQKTLNESEEKLGINHPNTAFIYSQIANYHLEQENYEEAMSLYQKSLNVFENVYGNEHFYTLEIIKKIAHINDILSGETT